MSARTEKRERLYATKRLICLVWTVCYELRDGKAPGRKAGVMARYLNPWALEVVKRHPKITVCDQWQFVRDNLDGLYTKWWKGNNVHFGGKPADELGRLLAEHVLGVLDEAK